MTSQRFRSGDRCKETGSYEFDGYLDGSSELLPFPGDMEIELTAGEMFPRIQQRHRACFWTPSEGQEWP